MEPLRAPAVDRWVVALCNEHQVTPADFQLVEGGMRLQQGAFTRVLVAWEKHWLEGGHEKALLNEDGMLETAKAATQRPIVMRLRRRGVSQR